MKLRTFTSILILTVLLTVSSWNIALTTEKEDAATMDAGTGRTTSDHFPVPMGNRDAQWAPQTLGETGEHTSMALDHKNRPHISFYEPNTQTLKYAHYDGRQWVYNVVDNNGDVGMYNSIAIDSSNQPHISYRDNTRDALKYARWDNNQTIWIHQEVDNGGSPGNYSSIAMDGNDIPHISYYESVDGNLKYAYYDGQGWIPDTPDSVGDVGKYSSIAIDGNNQPCIAYRDHTGGSLKYAYFDGMRWNNEKADPYASVGEYCSLVIDSDNMAHISYHDSVHGKLNYTKGSPGNWGSVMIDDQQNPGIYTSISVDSKNLPHIVYTAGWGWNTLRYKHFDGIGWSGENLDQDGIKGHVNIAVDNTDSIHICYNASYRGDLKYMIKDVGEPRVFDNTTDKATTGDEFIFNVTAFDNTGIQSASVTWNHGDTGMTSPLSHLGNTDRYQAIITLGDTIEDLKYTYTFNDSHGNSNITAEKTIQVMDNDMPKLRSDDTGGNATTGDPLEFKIVAEDNVEVRGVWINMSHGNTTKVKQLEYLSVFGDWRGTILVANDTSSITYAIIIRDRSNNTLFLDGNTIDVTDNDFPQFREDLTQGKPKTGSSFNVTVRCFDNVGVTYVSLFYSFDKGASFTELPMINPSDDVWTISLDVPVNAVEMHYKFQVQDAEEVITTNTTIIPVFDVIKPVAKASDNKGNTVEITIDEHQNVAFSADGCSDNIGIARYLWTFKYDGTDIKLEGVNADYSFEIPGRYNVTLNVTDAQGNWALSHLMIIVNDLTPPIPSVILDVDTTIEENGDYEIDRGASVHFNAKGSTDNGVIKSFTWAATTPSGDISVEGAELDHTFDIPPGKYVITLTVTDMGGNKADFTFNIVVRSTEDTEYPTADFTVEGELRENEGQFDTQRWTSLKFDASESSDNVGIVSYDWSIQTTGDPVTYSGVNINHRFTETGRFEVHLMVYDETGKEGTKMIYVEVVKRVAGAKTIGPIMDPDGNPVIGADVSFEHDGIKYNAVTGDDGYATFDVPFDEIPNDVHLVAEKDGTRIEWNQGGAIPALGSEEEGDDNGGLYLALLAGVIIIVIFILLIVRKNKKKKENLRKIAEIESELELLATRETRAEEPASAPGEKEVAPAPKRTPPAKKPEIKAAPEKEAIEPATEEWSGAEEQDETEEWGGGEEDEELPLPPPPEDLLEALPALELEAASSTIKNIIPGYIITDKLGSGGFATVYKAINKDGIAVAIKLPKFLDETIDSSVLKKFQAEADIWKKLKHKNIVTFLDSNVRPVPYMTIELMEGGNLAGLLKDHRLSVKDAKPLMLQIADGLSYAHRMASVHRDIKPENILFTKDGVPKIADWGIGKFMASESVSQSIGTKGTFAYAAPEQFDRETYGEVDWSTDIFQIGIVFYQMLTGVNPFMADELARVMGLILTISPKNPSELNPEVPPELGDIVMKCLKKQKEDRWRSTDVLYSKLKNMEIKKRANLKKYRRSLERALKDGFISEDEEEMLAELREHMNITDKEHETMVSEITG